ncbi:MAG: DUF423 domain-containing protein [Panacagrimonas sp.]
MAQASLAAGALFGFLGVVLGAFGAHALRARLSPEMLQVWKTANEYHFYHAIALVLVGLLARATKLPGLDLVAGCFVAGIVVFSGSLYLLAVSDLRWLGAITPIGGLLFVFGWAWLAWMSFRH